MVAFIDLSGHSYGRLKVTRQAPHNGRYVSWHCRCACGNKHVVTSHNLRSGNTNSCGCYKLERTSETHRLRNPDAEFEQRYKKCGPDDCWPWLGKLNSSGYGSFLGMGAHVYAYKKSGRKLPKKSLVLQVFQVHPTKRPKGAKHPNAKLTARQAQDIRKLYATGSFFQYNLAAHFKVSQHVISLITRGESYK